MGNPLNRTRERSRGLARFLVDLLGPFESTVPADDPATLDRVWRGDLYAQVGSAARLEPFVGDVARLGRLPGDLRAVRQAVVQAKVDAQFARDLEGALKRVGQVIKQSHVDKLPDSAQSQFVEIRALVERFLKDRWVRSLSRGQILAEAREHGSGSGQYADQRGNRRITVNVVQVIDLLDAASQPSRHPAAHRAANALLDLLAGHEWRISAGPHTSETDAIKHITVDVPGANDKQFHLRLDARGHLFEITLPLGSTPLTAVQPFASPGTPVGRLPRRGPSAGA